MSGCLCSCRGFLPVVVWVGGHQCDCVWSSLLHVFLPVVVLVDGCQCVWVCFYLLLSWLEVGCVVECVFHLLLSWWEVVSVVGYIFTCCCLGAWLSVCLGIFLPVVVLVTSCQCVGCFFFLACCCLGGRWSVWLGVF